MKIILGSLPPPSRNCCQDSRDQIYQQVASLSHKRAPDRTTDTFAISEEPWAVVALSVPPAPISGPGLVPDTIVDLNLDSGYSARDCDYDISNNNNEDNEIREVPRRCERHWELPNLVRTLLPSSL